jgi:hypothetical protein
MNTMDYRQNDKGGWDVYFNNEEFGITLWLPKGYKPEDYEIKFKTDDVSNATLRRCHNVNIEVLNTPENTTGRLSFDKYAGAHFVDNLMICVKDGFSLDFNENTLLGSSVPHSPDGFRRVYMDYFDLSHNYNVDVVFKDPASTAPVKELEEKDIPSNIFEGFIHENKNINFTVLANRGLLALMNNTYVPMRENNYQRLDVISNADHFGFAFNDISIKTTKEFIDKKRPAELNFNGDAVFWNESKLDILGVNTITLKSPSSSKPAILKGSKVEGFFSDADLELIGKKAKITGSSKVSLNLFGYSSLKANGNIAIEAKVENTSLYKAKIESKNGPLNVFDSKLDSVKAEFNMKKGIVASIKDSRIKASTITNQNGNIVKSNFANTIMENCTFGEDSTLELAKKTDIKYMFGRGVGNEVKNISYDLKNVELKEKSSIKTVFEAHWPEEMDYKEPSGDRYIKINNVIATGSNSLQRFVPASINNSILNNVLVFNYHPDVAINNSILGGSISLTNITSVESSDLCHAVIDASTPVKMENECVSYKNIKDYAKHIANKDKAIEDAETKDSIVTETIEIL